MKLHTTFITFNRLALTKQAIASYLETVSVPYSFSIEDNGSTDGTVEWLGFLDPPLGCSKCFHATNWYPGRATNHGWEWGVLHHDDITHLHRADNDFSFLPGWCEEVERVFEDGNVGQVGLRTGAEEEDSWVSVGGNCVIRRELWDEGLRFDERPWSEYEPGWTEDNYFSMEVEQRGYLWKRVEKPCIVPLDEESPDDPYYVDSWKARGILDWALERHGR